MTTMYFDPKTKTIRFPEAEAIKKIHAEMLQEFAELDEKEGKQNV
uniref:Uncharacterized protein n=1 Tax=Siphoviridae sp. ctTnV63 TaxID=2825523 RepID=A0A8S5NV08_9CAUD|nr:MAG TPA: hypothetical protein [Siphoviridae sp. ctTnV63]